MKNLKIFNTFSGKKENFIPLDPEPYQDLCMWPNGIQLCSYW